MKRPTLPGYYLARRKSSDHTEPVKIVDATGPRGSTPGTGHVLVLGDGRSHAVDEFDSWVSLETSMATLGAPREPREIAEIGVGAAETVLGGEFLLDPPASPVPEGPDLGSSIRPAPKRKK